MRYSFSLISSLLAVVAGVQAVGIPTQAAVVADREPVTIVRAIYLLTNNSPNKIVALKVNKDGTLSEGTFTPTGGNGGSYIGSDGAIVPTDALASQDCIVREGNVSGLLWFIYLSIGSSDPNLCSSYSRLMQAQTRCRCSKLIAPILHTLALLALP
jgi:hypothetical protein